jgi:hypothetical protein
MRAKGPKRPNRRLESLVDARSEQEVTVYVLDALPRPTQLEPES